MLLAFLIAVEAAPVDNIRIENPAEIVPVLQSLGYQAKLDLTGKVPSIDSSTSGWKYTIYFQGCSEGKACKDLLFYAGWKRNKDGSPTLEQINEFNREYRFSRAYLDKEQDPAVEMDAMFTNHEMRRAAFEEHLDVWADVLAKFSKHIADK